MQQTYTSLRHCCYSVRSILYSFYAWQPVKYLVWSGLRGTSKLSSAFYHFMIYRAFQRQFGSYVGGNIIGNPRTPRESCEYFHSQYFTVVWKNLPFEYFRIPETLLSWIRNKRVILSIDLIPRPYRKVVISKQLQCLVRLQATNTNQHCAMELVVKCLLFGATSLLLIVGFGSSPGIGEAFQLNGTLSNQD